MAELITPKKDIVFKKIFGSKGNEAILQDFLEYILDMKIKKVTLDLSTELLPDFYEGKNSRIDVRAELDDGSQVNIEMQSNKKGFSEKRCLQYWSKLYSNAIEKSDDYSSLRKTICIWIVDDTVYDDFKEFESKWKMKEEKLGIEGHFDEIEIHIIELKKFRETAIIKPGKRDFWLWFIDHTNKEMIELACIDNEKIKEAREQLDKISADKELMDIIRRQELYEWDMNTSINNAKEEGKAEGIKEGIKEGKVEQQLEIARNMKKLGISIEIISKVTGLSEEEIEKL